MSENMSENEDEITFVQRFLLCLPWDQHKGSLPSKQIKMSIYLAHFRKFGSDNETRSSNIYKQFKILTLTVSIHHKYSRYNESNTSCSLLFIY